MYQIGTYFLYLYHPLSSFYAHKLDKYLKVVSGTNHFEVIHLFSKTATSG